MGLLNQILDGLSGGATAGDGMGRMPSGRQAGDGRSRVMMALLPVVLGMLATRQRGAAGAMPDRERTGPGRLGAVLTGGPGGLGRSGGLGGGLAGLGASTPTSCRRSPRRPG